MLAGGLTLIVPEQRTDMIGAGLLAAVYLWRFLRPAGITDDPQTQQDTSAGSANAAAPAPKAIRYRTGTKQEAVIAMLRTEHSATIEEIMAATNWAGHTTRGFLSGALKKKLGLAITSEKVTDRGRVTARPKSGKTRICVSTDQSRIRDNPGIMARARSFALNILRKKTPQTWRMHSGAALSASIISSLTRKSD